MIPRHFASALVVAVSAAAFVAAPANASFVTYDFVNYIDNPSGTGIDNSGGEHGVTEKFRITGNGGTEQLTVTAHGTGSIAVSRPTRHRVYRHSVCLPEGDTGQSH